jgi:hypothetical protein
MSTLDVNRVRQALTASKIQSFSAELVALQSCRDEDELYVLLINAIDSEPFLMSRVVRVANSVMFSGRNVGFASGANECLMRIGLAMGKQIAEDFLIDQALGRIVRANRFSRSVWREARLAGSFAPLVQDYCDSPFEMGGPGLPVIMSYLGELLMMGLVKNESEVPRVSLQPEGDAFNLVEMSMLALAQLKLPEPVEESLRAVDFVGQANEGSVPQIKTAAAIVVCRWLVKVLLTGISLTAKIDDQHRDAAFALLGMGDDARETLMERARRLTRIG